MTQASRLGLVFAAQAPAVGQTKMGIDVQLRTESGVILAKVGDQQMVLSKAASGALVDTRLLKYLVPWGDAVFNQAQSADLRADVHQVIRSNSDTPLGSLLAKVEPLIDRLSAETHLYLWFVGD